MTIFVYIMFLFFTNVMTLSLATIFLIVIFWLNKIFSAISFSFFFVVICFSTIFAKFNVNLITTNALSNCIIMNVLRKSTIQHRVLCVILQTLFFFDIRIDVKLNFFELFHNFWHCRTICSSRIVNDDLFENSIFFTSSTCNDVRIRAVLRHLYLLLILKSRYCIEIMLWYNYYLQLLIKVWFCEEFDWVYCQMRRLNAFVSFFNFEIKILHWDNVVI